ncbi:MAG: hypothetical protein OEZ22_11600 [Spirochaetia bacterium]|nr:hypothetical protein [Spirochaetia bacterium]
MTKHKNSSQDDICCPEFHPEKWNEKTIKWKNKPFIKESIPAFFHIPFPPMIGRKIKKMMALAEKANKEENDKEKVLIMFTDPTPFKSEIYISVTGEVEGANNAPLTGTFITKVFDGGYNQIPKFVKIMNKYLEEKSKKAKNYYVHYAYCPRCLKKFGHNYMILFAKII